MSDTKQNEKNAWALEWVESIVFSLCFIILVFTFVIRIITVSGISMVPTLNDEDKLVISNAFFSPKQGDIIVVDGYSHYGQPIVKRVIGVAGDEVDINFQTGVVFVNGEQLQENYISAPTTLQYDVTFPLTVPENSVFVLGDNRPRSLDSRSTKVGIIDNRDILGKALFRVFPFQDIGGIQ